MLYEMLVVVSWVSPAWGAGTGAGAEQPCEREVSMSVREHH